MAFSHAAMALITKFREWGYDYNLTHHHFTYTPHTESPLRDIDQLAVARAIFTIHQGTPDDALLATAFNGTIVELEKQKSTSQLLWHPATSNQYHTFDALVQRYTDEIIRHDEERAKEAASAVARTVSPRQHTVKISQVQQSCAALCDAFSVELKAYIEQLKNTILTSRNLKIMPTSWIKDGDPDDIRYKVACLPLREKQLFMAQALHTRLLTQPSLTQLGVVVDTYYEQARKLNLNEHWISACMQENYIPSNDPPDFAKKQSPYPILTDGKSGHFSSAISPGM